MINDAPIFTLSAAADAVGLPVSVLRLLTSQALIDITIRNGQILVTRQGLQELFKLVAAADQVVGVQTGGRN